MKRYRNKAMVASLALMMIVVTRASAFSGMWVPMLIDRNIADMQRCGFELTAQDIYDVNHASLKDAILIFGGGCTGELVSDEGLILTNYHCGVDAVSKLSSTSNDLMANGYAAATRQDELPCWGLTVRRLVRMEDVTDECKKGEEAERKLIEKNKEDGAYEVLIEDFFGGNRKYMQVYEVFRDVRLVVAPPQELGNFGKETDNWMWPRHTADFCVFRVYADANNRPAAYKSSNVPYRPLKHLTVNAAGIKEGDMVMVMGYPGGTNQYLTSSALLSMRTHVWPKVVDLRRAEANELQSRMDANRKIAIDYASHFSSIANGLKRTAGEIECMDRIDIAGQKRADEAREMANNAAVAPLFAKADSLFGTPNTPTTFIRNMADIRILRDMLSGSGYTRLVAQAIREQNRARQKGLSANLDSLAQKFFARFDASTDEALAQAALSKAKELLTKQNRPDLLKSPRKTLKKLRNSVWADSTRFLNTVRQAASADEAWELLTKDFAYQFYSAIHDQLRSLQTANEADAEVWKNIESSLIASKMEQGQNIMPDANFTMRVTYGKIEAPRTGNAKTDIWQTTAQGIVEKNKTGNMDYALSPRVKELIAKAGNSQPTCFVGSLHTTGGNSGSPTLDTKGRLIGINFDRIWNGIASDYLFDPECSRNISVDIRYVLFVIETVCGAPHVVGEMNIVTE